LSFILIVFYITNIYQQILKYYLGGCNVSGQEEATPKANIYC